MPTTKARKTPSSRSTPKRSKPRSAQKPVKKSSAKESTKLTRVRGRNKAITSKSASPKKAAKKLVRAIPQQPVGIVAKAKSVIRPVLAGAAAAAAVIAHRDNSATDVEDDVSDTEVVRRGVEEEVESDSKTNQNAKRLKEGVLLDRRR